MKKVNRGKRAMSEMISNQPNEAQRMGLRERKKRLAQATIEDTALRLFRECGYEQTSIQDIADSVMMSPRTFFHYFASKEEILFAPLQAILAAGVTFLQHAPPAEPLTSALAATFVHMASIYQDQRPRFLARYQVAMATPSLASVYLYSLAAMEPRLCEVLVTRWETGVSKQRIRLLVAMSMAAFRMALELWLENEANGDLVSLVREHLELLLKTPQAQWETT
jgi:AcrR family transcriptional regulator